MHHPISDPVRQLRSEARFAALAMLWIAVAVPGCVSPEGSEDVAASPAAATASLAAGTGDADMLGSVVVGGNSHTCAIVNGGAQCWGSNSDGQLGNGVGSGESFQRVQVTGLRHI